MSHKTKKYRLIKTYPGFKLYKHQDWSGKYCPHIILDRKNGWKDFVNDVNKYVDNDKVLLIHEPNQIETLRISTSNPMSIDEIIELLKQEQVETVEPKTYSVEDLQRNLHHIGYDCGPFDGKPGPKTRAGFRAFQRLNKLDDTGNMDPESIRVMESIMSTESEYRTFWYKNCEVHVFTGDLDKYDPVVTLGEPGKLEVLSEMDDDFAAAVNGQFFGGGREGLGLMIINGLYYYTGQHEKFANWLQYKDGHSEIRDVDKSEYWRLQYETHFSIGTSWALMIEGKFLEIKNPGISHYDERHPRTIMAQSNIKKLLSLIVVDGRNENSKGMTAEETQELLAFISNVLDIEYDNATNLDGGGSSEMTVDQEIVNEPSDGVERKVGTIIGLKRKD